MDSINYDIEIEMRGHPENFDSDIEDRLDIQEAKSEFLLEGLALEAIKL